MKHTELTKQCLNLSMQDRKRLIRLLQESVDNPKPLDEGRFGVLYAIATEMFGNGILTSSRNYNLVLGRRFISYQLIVEGFSYSDIGRNLIRHHASIMHCRKMMEDYFKYPEMFKLELAYWNEFQKRLNEHDKTRKI